MANFSSLVWVVCENQSFEQAEGLQSHRLLARRGAVLTNYFAITHPSGPNYRSLVAGNYFTHDEILVQKKPTIATQTGVDTVVWSFKGAPTLAHNPFAELKSPHRRVTNLDLDSLPASCILYVGMDNQNNAHSGPVAKADANLVELIDRLDRSAWFKRPVHGRYPVLFVTWDEAYTKTNHVFAAFLGSFVQAGARIQTELNHYSFCRLVTDNWDQPALELAATAPRIPDIWVGDS